VAWATNAITEGRARFRIGTQWFSRTGCCNRRAPARPCGRGKLAQFSLLQRFAVCWVAPPWPILPVPAVLLALCRLVVANAVAHCNAKQWTYKVIRFLHGEIGEQELLAQATDASRKTEILIIAGRISGSGLRSLDDRYSTAVSVRLFRHSSTRRVRDPEDREVDDHLLAERVEDEEVVVVEP